MLDVNKYQTLSAILLITYRNLNFKLNFILPYSTKNFPFSCLETKWRFIEFLFHNVSNVMKAKRSFILFVCHCFEFANQEIQVL